MSSNYNRSEYSYLFRTMKEIKQFTFDNAKVKSVLIIAPHADDEIIGCGGSLLWHLEQGHSVTCCYLTDGSKGTTDTKPNRETVIGTRQQETEQVHKKLKSTRTIFWEVPDTQLEVNSELVWKMRDLLLEVKPDLIYVSSPFERHSDHKNAFYLLKSAIEEIRTTGYSLEGFVNIYSVWDEQIQNSFMDITGYMDAKLELLDLYESQAVFSIKKLTIMKDELAALRKQVPNVLYCEGFYRVSVNCLEDAFKKLI